MKVTAPGHAVTPELVRKSASAETNTRRSGQRAAAQGEILAQVRSYGADRQRASMRTRRWTTLFISSSPRLRRPVGCPFGPLENCRGGAAWASVFLLCAPAGCGPLSPCCWCTRTAACCGTGGLTSAFGGPLQLCASQAECTGFHPLPFHDPVHGAPARTCLRAYLRLDQQAPPLRPRLRAPARTSRGHDQMGNDRPHGLPHPPAQNSPPQPWQQPHDPNNQTLTKGGGMVGYTAVGRRNGPIAAGSGYRWWWSRSGR